MTDFKHSQFNSDKLYETIKEISTKIPDVDKNQSILKKLNKIIYNVAYTAPEIMHTRWYDLYCFIYTVQKKNKSEWVNEISQVWNKTIL